MRFLIMTLLLVTVGCQEGSEEKIVRMQARIDELVDLQTHLIAEENSCRIKLKNCKRECDE